MSGSGLRGHRGKRLLQRGRDVPGVIWRALNSGIVLWLLSSVVLASMSQWWTKRQSDLAAARLEQEQERRLRIEMTDRLMSLALTFNASDRTYQTARQACRESGICEPSQKLAGFPEFSERSFSSLLWELSERRPDLAPRIQRAQAQLAVFRSTLAARDRSEDVRREESDAALASECTVMMMRVDASLRPFLADDRMQHFARAYQAQLEMALKEIDDLIDANYKKY